jgi:hypothetical protein
MEAVEKLPLIIVIVHTAFVTPYKRPPVYLLAGVANLRASFTWTCSPVSGILNVYKLMNHTVCVDMLMDYA